MSHSSLIDSQGLPLNRKERFYTGTVLPAILCADNFAHLHRLARVLPGCPPLNIDASPETTNLQFFTEYGLWESIFDPATRDRFPGAPTMRDTPDIVIFIGGEDPALIALEAKMFHRPTANSVVEQMRRQGVLLNYVAETLGVPLDRVIHAALLPQGLLSQPGYEDVGLTVVTWEDLLAAFLDGKPGDYWTSLLQLALQRYQSLASHVSGYDIFAQDHWTGKRIHAESKGVMKYNFMGREGGLDGPRLAQDLQSGAWETRVYQVREDQMPPSKNWFLISEFVARLPQVAQAPAWRSGPQPSALAVEVVERAIEQLRGMGRQSVSPVELFDAANSVAWDMGFILTKPDVWAAVYDWGGFAYHGEVPSDSQELPL